MNVHMIRWLLLWWVLGVLSCWTLAALAEERVALVIGNGVYSGANPLPNASNDARAVAALLEQLDFQVLEGIDLEKPAMDALLVRFSQELDGAQVGLFFYSGHGVQRQKENFLSSTDTDFGQFDQTAMLALNDVLDILQQAPTRLVWLDAAWENPLSAESSIQRSGLAPLSPPENGLVALSAQPDRPIPYREEENSAFALALLEVLESPSRDLGTLLVEVAARVTRQTDGQQLPWVSINLDAPLRLATAPPPVALSDAAPAPTLEETQIRLNPDLRLQAAKVEGVVFETARRIRMPAMRELALEDYLRRFPRGHHAAEARRLLDELRDGLRAQDPALVHWHPGTVEPTEPWIASEAETDTTAPEPAQLSGPALAEQQLGLDRRQRQEVQWSLTALGFDTGGVDGVFGSLTRQSISAYQLARGMETTGYLQEPQWRQLIGEGENPVAALKAERARLAEQNRRAAAAAAAAAATPAQPTTPAPVSPTTTRVVVVNPEAQLRLQRLQAELDDVRWRLQREQASASGARWTLQLDYQSRIKSLEEEIQTLRSQLGES